MQTKKFNHNYEGGTPLGVGDRYYAQDLSRDNRYLQTLALRGLSAIYDTDSGILNGLQLTKKSKSLLGLTAGVGYCHCAVTIVDDDQPWAVPPQTKTEDILGLVDIETQDIQITPAMKNGNKHYVKAIYKEKVVQSRTRQASGGSYGYVVVDSYEIRIDETEPTKYEVLLGTFQGTDEITVTGEKPIPSKIPDDIRTELNTHIAKTTEVHGATSAPTANKIAIRDGSGRLQVANPSTANDAANKAYVDTTSKNPLNPGTPIVINESKTQAITPGWYFIELWGAGGAGGGKALGLIQSIGQSGGSGGAYKSVFMYIHTNSISVSIGKGGIGNALDGTDGGPTKVTIGSLTLIASGGQGGSSWGTINVGTGASGGRGGSSIMSLSGSQGEKSCTGSAGGSGGDYSSDGSIYGGGGGGGGYQAGGDGGTKDSPNGKHGGIGAGGGGCASNKVISVSHSGGNGGNGIVILTPFNTESN